MLAGRWCVVALLFGSVLLGAGVSVAAQDALPDLLVSQVMLSPSLSVASGDPVTATVVAERSGPPLTEDAPVDITWRRRDREEPCGTSAGVFPAGEGPRALQFVVVIPTSDLAPGAYEVVATIDPNGSVAETSESNNRLAASLEIQAPKPELHPVSAEVTPTAPLAWGETATLVAGVMNTGRAAAGPFYVTFSTFPVYCVDEASGEHWAVVPSETMDSDGLLELRFIEDPDGSRSPQVLGLPSLVGALPEEAWVVFSEEQVSGLERDGQADATAVFTTGLPLRQLLTTSGLRDGAIASSAMALLPADDVERLESCVTTYAVRIGVADAYGVPDEDPTNNRLHIALSVKPSSLELADLVPIAASFSRAMPLDWDNDVDVEVVIANRGGGAAPASGAASIGVSFSYRLAGTATWNQFATRTIDRLGIDEDTSAETVEATIDASPGELDLAPGSYELRVSVDKAGAIPEQDEQNNEIVVGFSVQGTELHPVGLEVTSSSIRQGDSVEVIATIENTGDRSLEGFSVGFFVGDVRFATFAYRASATSDPGLEEEDRARVRGTLSTEDLVPGTYSLRVVADPDNRIPELDETNNQIRATITVLSPVERLAELYVSEVILDPASPIPAGDPVVVRTRVRNGGTMDAGRFSVAFAVVRDDGTLWNAGRIDCATGTASGEGVQACACQTADGLARGSSKVLVYTLWTSGWPEGRYALHVWADLPTPAAPQGEARELDETNNEMILTFSIGRPVSGGVSAGANLVIDAVSLQPAAAPAGAAGTVLFLTIANRGTEAAGAFHVSVRWVRADGATLVLAQPAVNGLGPSQSTTIRQGLQLGSIGWTCGNHTFQIIVDPDSDVAEAGEGDNVASTVYRVDCGGTSSYGPDLTVSLSVPAAPDGVLTTGCPATAELTVANRGGLNAGAFRVELRQGTTVIDIEDVAALAAQETTTVHVDLNSAAPGSLRLSAVADAEGRIAEQNETNNTAELTVTVAPRDESSVTRIGGPYRGTVSFAVLDASSGIVLAASDDGGLHAFSRGSPAVPLYDASLDDNAEITGLALDRGTAVRTVYVTTASGTLHRFALSSGARVGIPVRVGDTTTGLALDAAGTAYVGTEDGIAVVRRSGVTATSIGLGARVVALAVDASGTLIYAITASTLYGVSTSTQSVVCSAGSFGSDATALALGPTGVYVGTSAGRVIAFSPCASYGALGTAMLRSWNVDLSSTGGTVTSLAVYPETAADPVYVALCENGAGRVVALALAGRMLWTSAGTALGCVNSGLSVDRTRGRVTFAESDGTIHVLSDRGEVLLVEDAIAGLGKSIQSEIVTDSFVGESDGVSRFVELFYAGTSDGNLYVVETERGGCP